jgi:hypothetical protein
MDYVFAFAQPIIIVSNVPVVNLKTRFLRAKNIRIASGKRGCPVSLIDGYFRGDAIRGRRVRAVFLLIDNDSVSGYHFVAGIRLYSTNRASGPKRSS